MNPVPSALRCTASHGELAIEEISYGGANFRVMRFECEVPCVVQVDLGIRVISAERLGACREEERVVFAPHRKDRGALRTEVLLKLWIERDVARVIQEQVKL